MCKAGNQTVTKECFQELLKQTGRKSLSNKDIHELLKAQGGCATRSAEKVA